MGSYPFIATAADVSLPISIANGGTGQVTAAAAYNALSPMTTTGDMEYDSSAATAARLAIGAINTMLASSGSLPEWELGLLQQATTGGSGYALVNGTGTIISWTAPNDGNMHRVLVFAVLHITSNETGGTIALNFDLPDGTTGNKTIFSQNQSASVVYPLANNCPQFLLVEANTAVSLSQSTALTGGAATLFAELWAS